jgi:UMF1 family MFS transporter
MTPPMSSRSISESFLSRARIFSWTLFDFAITAFFVVILTVGYPLYFKEIVAQGSPQGDLLWGSAFSISMCFVAFLSPVLGAAADYGAGKKRFLFFFTFLCVVATALLYFVGPGSIFSGVVLLVLANIGYEAGLVFYDAFLPEIATERTYGRVSGYGFAMGYVGSLTTLLITYPLYAGGFVPSNLHNVQLSFLVAAGMCGIFALPLFLFLPDRQKTAGLHFNYFRIGLQRVKNTFREFPKYRNTAKFLLSYFIYIDAVNTIIIFSSLFARTTLHFSIVEIVIFFAMIQTSAMIGAVLFGILSDHIGHKQTLIITLFIWMAVVVAAYFIYAKFLFYGVGIIAGLALGSSQSTSRSLMTELTPPEKKTEFFGFYSFFGRAACIVGPFVFGLVSWLVNQRVAILSVGLFLLAGIILLQRVQVPAGTSEQ